MVAYNHPGTISESPILVGDTLGFYYKGNARKGKVVEIKNGVVRCEDLLKGGYRCFTASEMKETHKIIA